jgi:hypothetical protein
MDTDATWTTPARPASVLPASTPTTIRAALPRGRPPPRSGERRRVASTSDDQIWRPPFLFLFFFVRESGILRSCDTSSLLRLLSCLLASRILLPQHEFSCASQASCAPAIPLFFRARVKNHVGFSIMFACVSNFTTTAVPFFPSLYLSISRLFIFSETIVVCPIHVSRVVKCILISLLLPQWKFLFHSVFMYSVKGWYMRALFLFVQ